MIKNQDSNSGPIQELFIYYLNGYLRPGSRLMFNNFLGNWEEDGFSFLFFSRPSDKIIDQLLATQPQLTIVDKYNMSYDEWHGEKIRPVKIGSFLITPPWEENKCNRDSKKQLIILDPGVVFGTGTHPTTHDCLEALESLCHEETVESMLDLGTGTGLLALAAAKLGCNRILAVDFNYLAAGTARKNVRLNKLERNVMVVHGCAEDFVDRPADLVISNIHYDVMRHLIQADAFLDHKWFILSGLLRSQARDVVNQLGRLPVQIMNSWENGSVWHTFLGKINVK